MGALAELELADEASLPLGSNLPKAEPAPSFAMHYKVQFTADQEYAQRSAGFREVRMRAALSELRQQTYVAQTPAVLRKAMLRLTVTDPERVRMKSPPS